MCVVVFFQEGCLLVFGGVNKVDTSRTNCLQAIWLTVPALKTISWSVVWKHLDITKIRENHKHLLELGVPDIFLPSPA